MNSSTELEYHLIVASDRKLISAAQSLTLRSQVIEVRKMLYVYAAISLLAQLQRRSLSEGSV